MRVRKSDGNFSVHAVAGTYVVMFGFDLPKAACVGLLGFSIHRTDHTENEAYYLEGQKAFQQTDPGFPTGPYSTKTQPIQSFQWADYSAKPGHQYSYVVTALKGSPENLISFAAVAIDVGTESPEGGIHDIYFNRGVAASQAYVRRFGNKRPDDPSINKQAFEWLSRGLYEAMTEFIAKDAGPGVTLRVAAYEFNYRPLLLSLGAAASKGSDVRIVYDARKENPRVGNRDAVAATGIGHLTKERLQGASYISHNKFIVRLVGGSPVAVWTGGTNFSDGGIFGHSNVAHVIEDPDIAQAYLDYWTLLNDDLANSKLKPKIEALAPLPDGEPPVGVTPVFSPRKNLDALNWYAALAGSAKQGLFMTFAFGINEQFQSVYRDADTPLRMALLEKKTRPMAPGPERDAEEAKIDALRRKNQNVFAIGSLIPNNKLNGWVRENLSGLNHNVNYVHNKFMLIDPLSDHPIVIAGSANFSNASTTDNDENMVVVRGDKRTADIYLGEFMRFYNHHAFRESLNWRKPADQPKWLRTDEWWSDFFNGSSRESRRKFFA